MSAKILIIEDDSSICSMYRIQLTQDGYNVITSDNGAQGLELAINEKPDLILLDIVMPQLDGFSVLQSLKSSKSDIRNIPVVLLTNLSTEEDRARGEKYGAAVYLVKASLTPSQVSAMVKKILETGQ